MNFIRLVHHKKLKYPAKKQWIPIPRADWERFAGTHDVLLSFRPVEGVRPAREMEQVAAYTRYLDIASQDVQHIVCYELEESSIFYPLVLWDLAHTLPVGGTITIVGENTWLCRDYYHGAMELIEEADGVAIWQKLRPLLIEQDAGLDAWTFGIPTGPGDAEGLNAIIERILELDIPQKEILLCGRPGDNFRYWDQVRIVGEDIPYPPVRICAKKNRLAQEAKYPNLCIMHDRVYLPKDFGKAVRRFGDFFGVSGFQSLYFGDKWNCSFVRYSDQCRTSPSQITGMDTQGNVSAIAHSNHEFAFLTFSCFWYDALHISLHTYMTGSLYLSKKALWNAFPQNTKLCWDELEDVDFGEQLWKAGIPSVLNPYSLTQSLYGRQLVLANGGKWYYPLIHGKGKAVYKFTVETYAKKYHAFCEKYHCECPEIPRIYPFPAKLYFKALFSAVYDAKFPVQRSAVRQFLQDVEKYLVMGQHLTYCYSYWTEKFCEHTKDAKEEFLRWSYWTSLYMIYDNRPLFPRSGQEFLVSDSLWNRWGSFSSACRLAWQNGKFLFHPDGLWGFYRSIVHSTPYKRKGGAL